MEDNKSETNVNKLIDSAQSIIIILPPDPGKDLVAAGIGLHLAFKNAGKVSQIGCGSEVQIDNEIEGITNIPDSIGSRNLIISFDYREEDLDKVDYDVRDNGKFYLMVKPKTGAPVPDIGGVKYSYSGAQSDLVITLGITSLEELGKIYADEKNFLDNATLLSLNNTLRPATFTGNLFHKNISSFSELVIGFLKEIKYKLPSSISQNLLTNIYESSNNLTSSNLTADTFEAIAFLMRSGAHLPKQTVQAPRFSQPPFFEVPEVPSAPAEENIPLPEEENTPVPPDWNKPKIFRVGDNN